MNGQDPVLLHHNPPVDGNRLIAIVQDLASLHYRETGKDLAILTYRNSVC